MRSPQLTKKSLSSMKSFCSALFTKQQNLACSNDWQPLYTVELRQCNNRIRTDATRVMVVFVKSVLSVGKKRFSIMIFDEWIIPIDGHVHIYVHIFLKLITSLSRFHISNLLHYVRFVTFIIHSRELFTGQAPSAKNAFSRTVIEMQHFVMHGPWLTAANYVAAPTLCIY